MGTLISALLAAGPTLIRTLGQSKGGATEVISETVADVIDSVQGKPLADQQAAVQTALKSASPDVLAQMQTTLAQIEADKQKAQLDHDLGMHTEQQKTIRAGDASKDEYVSHTRPKIARQSFWAMVCYVIAFEAAHIFGKGTGANWELAGLIASPMLAYFGFRTWDKFSKQGTSK